MDQRFCPKCGAYWQCDCVIEYTELQTVLDPACYHDWVEAVGVETDPALGIDASQVKMCRLCGLYTISASV